MPAKFKPVVKGPQVFVQARIAYQHLTQPYAGKEGDKPAYSCCAIISKEDAAVVEKTIAAFRETPEALGVWGGKRPSTFKQLIHDGDEREDAAFKGRKYFNCKSYRPVSVQNRDKLPIVNESEIYSGMWGIVCLNIYAYNNVGGKGVALGLEAVLKTADDTAFTGSDGANAFNDINVPDDDDDDDDIC